MYNLHFITYYLQKYRKIWGIDGGDHLESYDKGILIFIVDNIFLRIVLLFRNEYFRNL